MQVSFERIVGLERTGYAADPSDLMNHVPTPDEISKMNRDMQNAFPRPADVYVDTRKVEKATRKFVWWRATMFLSPLLWMPIAAALWFAYGPRGLWVLAGAAATVLLIGSAYGAAMSLTKMARSMSREARGNVVTGLALLSAAVLLGVALAMRWPPSGWGH